MGAGNKGTSFALYYQIGKYLTELRCLEAIVSVAMLASWLVAHQGVGDEGS